VRIGNLDKDRHTRRRHTSQLVLPFLKDGCKKASSNKRPLLAELRHPQNEFDAVAQGTPDTDGDT
jgi:hypothetical protein